MKTTEVAAAVGVSPQQIRNYLDERVLPPAPRTASGYRVLDDRHVAAGLALRALGAAYGWRLAKLLMVAIHDGRLAEGLVALDESVAALHSERMRIAETMDAFERLRDQPREPVRGGPLSIGELAGRLRLRRSALRVWEREGLLRPQKDPRTGYRFYTADDVRDAQTVLLLRGGGYRLAAIAAVLEGLRRGGGQQRVREALERRREALLAVSAARLRASALLARYLELADIEL